MWYLIKELSMNQYAVRYCESTNRTPTTMLYIGDSYSCWADDMNLLNNRIDTDIHASDFLTIDEMATDSSYTIIPLPDVSPDITSITSILEAHPELLI